MQSILTVATSCGSSKTSLNSTKLSSSQKQIDSHLESPSTSTHDNDADILHEYRVSHADNNTAINLDRYDLAVSKEKTNDTDVNIPGSKTKSYLVRIHIETILFVSLLTLLHMLICISIIRKWELDSWNICG